MKKIKYISFFILVLFLQSTIYLKANNRIVYLISNPRSSMLEFLRMIGERGDFKVMHIPANYAYCHANDYVELVKGWYREDAPSNYVQAKEDILKEAEKKMFLLEKTPIL